MKERRKILFYGDSNTYGYDPADWKENRYPASVRWTDRLAEDLKERWEVLPKGLNGRCLPDGLGGQSMIDRFDGHGMEDQLNEHRLQGESRVNGTLCADRLEEFLARLKDRDVFAVMLGTNDLLMATRPDAGIAIERMKHLLVFLTLRRSRDSILIISPPLVGNEALEDPFFRKARQENRRMNDAFAELAREKGVMFADASTWNIELAFDFVHFSERGHRRFGACMKNLLENI